MRDFDRIWPFVALAVANALAIPTSYYFLRDIDTKVKEVFELSVRFDENTAGLHDDEEKR